MEHHRVLFVPLPHHCSWLLTVSKRQQRFTSHLQSAQSWSIRLYQVWILFFCLPLHSVRGGSIGIYGTAVLSFFFKRYFGNFYFNVRYWGTSSPAVCGFLFSFWVDGISWKEIMRYRPFALSCLIQVKTIYNAKHSKLNRLIRVKILSLWK